ncbi:hypothetical protein O181_033936 [Austropuccinia psidii MF-1]|uniref:Cyclin N-terminal domain-containing protein n=1 Tax=Austropuccinia psidii MF-1 TaxID=1389203 RepID=A0A9Q3CZQ2_9BASI|nr:hypothetical protein [Austropuccinia psidii MF-1]
METCPRQIGLSTPSAGSETKLLSPNMLRRHPASLIPRHLHNPLLLGLLKAPVNEDLIEYVSESTLAVVTTPADPIQLPTPPTTPVKSNFRRTISRPLKQASTLSVSTKDSSGSSDLSTSNNVPSLITFIKLTASRSNAQAPTLLVTLVYLDRLRRRLKGAKAAKGMHCTYHRLFLACLIASAKFCNDCCPRNHHWVKWSGLFTLSEVNLMEQELLILLDYDLRVDEQALLDMCAPFVPSSKSPDLVEQKAPTLTSCTTSRSPSSNIREDMLTPVTSPIVIRLDTRHVSSPLAESQNKKPKISETNSNPTSTVLQKAKSWYGNLRAATGSS